MHFLWRLEDWLWQWSGTFWSSRRFKDKSIQIFWWKLCHTQPNAINAAFHTCSGTACGWLTSEVIYSTVSLKGEVLYQMNWKSTSNSLQRISKLATQFSGGWANEVNFHISSSWHATFFVFLVSILVILIHVTRIWFVSHRFCCRHWKDLLRWVGHHLSQMCQSSSWHYLNSYACQEALASYQALASPDPFQHWSTTLPICTCHLGPPCMATYPFFDLISTETVRCRDVYRVVNNNILFYWHW